MRTFPIVVIVCASVAIGLSSARAATITVAAGGNLQQAINNASPGDTIALEAGATFSGNFTLPAKSGNEPITIRTAGDAGLPAEGVRISPANAASLAKIRQGNGAPVFATAAGAHHWRLLLLEVQGIGGNDLVTLGDGSGAQSAAAQIPHDLLVDRVYLHGDAAAGQKRGIALNSASTSVINSYIADIKSSGQDSQAIAGWNGPGPFTIANNYLEASGENVMFGGADPTVSGLVPADITITGNHVAKRPEWRGGNWVVKNLIELKNARRVSIAGNTFEYNWQAGQSGYAVVLTVRNQDGGCPWCQVDHVTFEQNIVRHSAAGVQILGYDNDHPSQQTQAIVLRNNVFADIDNQNWGGNGYFLSLTGGARDITIDHNTIASDHGSGIANMDGPPVLGFVFTNNLAKHNAYGFIGTDHGVGLDSISAYLPGANISRNVIADGSASRYPATNSFPAAAQFEAQFTSYAGGDYRLIASSPWKAAGSDGADLGASLQAAGGGAAAPPPPPRVELHTGVALPPAVLGSAYAGSLTVTGGSGPYVWTLVSGTLPDGLQLDAPSGTVAGQPQVFGTFPFAASVTDVPSGVTAIATATLVVAPKPITIVTTTLDGVIAGVTAYAASVAAGDGAPPLRWSVAAGSLPNGLSLDATTGVISGAPELPAGRYDFTIAVTDSWTPAQTTTRRFTIQVRLGRDPGEF